ncbi:MAG: TonB-dependent receptor [Bryobacteraceae bacterium]
MPKTLMHFTLAAILAASVVTAQETRSTIFGRVVDPQNAGVVTATVVVTNTGTNTTMTLKTNDTGYYEADLLLPGNYQVSAEAAGFKKSLHSGIALPLSTRVEINMQLQLGQAAETVMVTAEAPLLDPTASVSAGRVMDSRDVVDLPIFNNSPLMMIKLVPGVQSSNNRRYNGVNALGGTSDAHAVGGFANDWSIDGVPDMGNNAVAYMPYSTTIQEYKVETENFDASVGHTAGASIETMTKAGTNAFHGDLTEQYWNQRWNGTPFFVKQAYFRSIAQAAASGNNALAQQLRNSPQQPSGHDNDYGADIGGPVILPKLINGKNKLFFFFSFDGFDDRKTTGSANNHTVPTLPERQGDFSDLLAVSSSKYQLYDPLTVRPDPSRAGHLVRDPIPGNIIPKSRVIDPAYQTYLKFIPAPNNLPVSSKLEPLNDYVDPAEPYNWFYEAFANRYDYQLSEKNRFFGHWNWLKYREDRQDWTYTTDRGLMTNGVNRNNLGAMADWVYTPTASTVFDVEAGANNFREGNILSPVALAFTPSTVGLPAYMDAKAGVNHALPVMNFSGYDALGQSVPAWTHYEILSLKGNAFHIRGAHTFRAGIDVRDHRRSGGDPGNASGLYSFNNAYTCREDDCLTTTGSLGYSWAAFMMGIPTTSNVDTNATYATSNPYIGTYVQDNWRVNSRLSLNLGFRIEYEFGIKERYNREIAGFNPAATLPITALAEAAYAQNPIPELAGSAFAVLGGSVYTNTNGASPRFPAGQLMFLPRAGAAYQINSATVVRGGYGMYYDTLNAQTLGPDQSGFSRTTSDPSSTNFGQTWLSGDPANGVSPMADSFPVRSDGTRFDTPVGNALGLMARDGNGWTFVDPNFKRARVQRWRAELERQFGANTVISVAYTGMRADDLRITRTLAALPAQYWATGTTRNNTVASNLNQNVTNPFYIGNFASLETSDPVIYQALSSTAFFRSSTIRKSQLLQPFSQMNGLSESGPYGTSKAHSVEAVFRRRFSSGFTINANFTGLYERDQDYYYNQFDAAPSWELTNNGVPYRFAATGIYELPFGKGKPLVHAAIPAAIIGGWQIAATYEGQPGPLLQWGNVFYNGNVNNICSGSRTLDQWFTTSGFVTEAAQQPAAFQARVFPTRIGNCRADGLNVLNTNIQRTFKIRERFSFQLRMDALNVMNHSQFNPPDLNPTDSTFGKITDNTSSTMRFILIQGRIRF